MKVLVGMTGSVATTIAPKIVKAIEDGVPLLDSVEVVMTDKAQMFFGADALRRQAGVRVYTERDEWIWSRREHPNFNSPYPIPPEDKWQKGDPILHVELAKRSSCLVIAPASANTLGKMAHGICDNLLTSVFLAWRRSRPVVVAPSMNSHMWSSPVVQASLKDLRATNPNIVVVPPVEKELACGDVGVGALADAGDIAKAVACALRWDFPLPETTCPGIPVGNHLGSFGIVRRHGKRHCGVDLYCRNGTMVTAVEPGVVVAIDGFTGASVGSPWWNETKAVKVEGASGVVCYGEIRPYLSLKVGDMLGRGDPLGQVEQVLPDGQLRGDIPGHSLSMLHIQLYEHGRVHKDESWLEGQPQPGGVLDPTPFLLDCWKGLTLDMPEAKA
jgi:3-polyprenyl-4-hydroxybenzoate decarboxylase